jgi:hypothetical protein
MKRWTGMMTLLAFLAAGAAIGQTKSVSESTTKEKGAQGSMKTKTKTVTGTVKEYEAGKKIKISGPGDKSYSFDLDQNARIEGNIAVGQMAKIEYTKDSAGKDQVTVLSEAKAGAKPSSSKSEAEAAETRASHGESSMHMESTMKHKGPGPNTKIKTESVIGTVKSYEAGKKIVVTGPKDKDYSFDLSENVATKGTIGVGERVKVTYSKADGGDKVTTVEASPAASHTKKTKKTAA